MIEYFFLSIGPVTVGLAATSVTPKKLPSQSLAPQTPNHQTPAPQTPNHQTLAPQTPNHQTPASKSPALPTQVLQTVTPEVVAPQTKAVLNIMVTTVPGVAATPVPHAPNTGLQTTTYSVIKPNVIPNYPQQMEKHEVRLS